MFVELFSICAVVQLVVSQELPVTFKDGKIGVNFGGYRAEAGLGGLLTGNAAHGGLTASAGTPFGQTAQAGLGGNTGPNTRGGLFAGASAGDGVGASASLAGDVSNGGTFGVGDAEAHAGGISKSVTKTVSTDVETNVDTIVDIEAPVVIDTSELQTQTKPQSIYTETQSVIIQSTTPVVQIEQSEHGISTILKTTPSTTTTSSSYLAPETTVASVPAGSVTYLPTSEQAQSGTNIDASSSSISSSSINEDDNDLTDNKVPQIPVVQQQTVTKVVNPPATINVQKIKVRPRPQTVVQRIEEVQTTTAGPTTTTSSTTPRPPYVYTYDKQKVINEIFSIPIHALRAVNEIINAKLSGGYSVQKTITYN